MSGCGHQDHHSWGSGDHRRVLPAADELLATSPNSAASHTRSLIFRLMSLTEQVAVMKNLAGDAMNLWIQVAAPNSAQGELQRQDMGAAAFSGSPFNP